MKLFFRDQKETAECSRMGARSRGRSECGFNLMELVAVIAIVTLLTGIGLGTAAWVRNQEKARRAQIQIAALEAALEQYRHVNGIYPVTIGLELGASYGMVWSDYRANGSSLYEALAGRIRPGAPLIGPIYEEFHEQEIEIHDGKAYLIDPYGHPYGFTSGENALCNAGLADLWSTGETPLHKKGWITNWK